jgi:phosphomannomutase
LYNNSVVEKINGMAYIFTLLMFRKPNKTTINKIKTTIFIGQDGRHLSNEGIKVLAANLRSAVENVLKIGTYRRRRYADLTVMSTI